MNESDVEERGALTMVEALREAMFEEMARDERMVLYGEDIGVAGGVFRVTQGLIDEYPDRVFDFPVAEAGIVGMGVGLSAAGLRPVAEIQFAGFAHQAFHQLQHHASRLRTRSRGSYNVNLTVRAPYGGGVRALEHHSESFEAGYAHTPGLQVVVPSQPADAKGLLTSAIRDPDPVMFLEPMPVYRALREEVPEGEHVVPLREAHVVKEGEEVTIVAWGAMLREARRAADAADVSVEVVDLRTVSPMDTETVLESIRKTGRCVVVHEAPLTAGMAAEITARINDEALYYLEAPVERVTGYDVPFPLFAREEAYIPDQERIREAIGRAARG